jgi:hypothetical protein
MALPTEPEALPLDGVVMGSESDWSVMSDAAQVLTDFEVPFEVRPLDGPPCWIHDFEMIARAGAVNSLSQVVLKIAAPGVPDVIRDRILAEPYTSDRTVDVLAPGADESRFIALYRDEILPRLRSHWT